MTVRVLISPDSYKGTLSAADAADAISAGMKGESCVESVVSLPLGDGGDGTVEALTASLGGQMMTARVLGPLGAPVGAQFSRLRDGAALVEMATASGLVLVGPNSLDPFLTTSYGTGQLLLAAREVSNRIILGIGGSATVDGGVGMARAMGARFLDENGEEVLGGPREFHRIASVDFGAAARTWREEITLKIMSDVDNPLLGDRGAAQVFAPQKGACPEDIPALERALCHLAVALSRACGRPIGSAPGHGAAGGLGAMVDAMLGAEIVPGAEFALELVRFDDHALGSGIVVTGEGRMDAQTMGGKLPLAVARRAHHLGIPAAALPGFVQPGDFDILTGAFDYIVPCYGAGPPAEIPGPGQARERLISAARTLASRICAS